METFKLPGRDTRLIKHNDTVYKIKLVYDTKEAGSSLPCDVKSVQQEIEEAISVILSGTLTPLKTDHFIIHTERKQWKLASHLTFTHHNQRLNVHASMFTLYIQARQDVGAQPRKRRSQSPQTQSMRQKEQASTQARPLGARKHTRRYEVKETLASSPPRPKKPRSSDKRIQDQELEQPGLPHRQYSLRNRDRLHSPDNRKRETTSRYHFRSQGQASQAKECQASQEKKQRGDSTGSEDRDTQQGKQDYVRRTSKPEEAEPRVGATASAQSPPAYPQGGVVQQDVQVRQLGRHEGEQYQLEEQMRLQRLAGNPQPPATAVAHYQLRSRGPFQRLVNAVLTPVKNLFT
ncbi:uncharacterized protein LOC119741737 isoform X2 [Patiria miniata]|nr:uncharacterized protein LOC119741737 isoform X2 [Patiria miniata]